MFLKDIALRYVEKTVSLLSRLEQALHTIYGKLVTERRWFAVLSAAVSDFWQKKMYYYSGYFTYSAFLAVLALLVASSAVLGFLMHSSDSVKEEMTKALQSVAPVISGTSKEAVNSLTNYRNVIGVLGIIALLWTGTKIFSTLEWAFCEIWESKRRSYARSKVLGLALISMVGVIFLLSFLVQFAFTAVWAWAVGKESVTYTVGSTLFKPVIGLAVNFAMFLFMYKVIPTVKQSFRNAMSGAIVSALLFLGLQYLLWFYFVQISNIPSVYGSLATAVILIIMLHLTGMIIFLGAEIVRMLGDEGAVEKHRMEAKLPTLFKRKTGSGEGANPRKSTTTTAD